MFHNVLHHVFLHVSWSDLPTDACLDGFVQLHKYVKIDVVFADSDVW